MDNCFLSPLNHGEMGFLDPTAFDLDVLSLPATINTTITTATNTNNTNTTTMTVSASSSMDTILNPNHHLDGFVPQQLVQQPQQPQELVHSNGLAYPCPFNVDMDPSQWAQGAQMDTSSSSTVPQTNALIPVNTDAHSSVNDQTSFSASGGPMVMTPSATSATATSSPSSLHELAACSPAIAALLPLLVSNPQAKSVLPNLAASIGKPPVKPKVSQQALSQKVQELLGLTGINTGNGTGMTVTPASSAVPPIKITKSSNSRARAGKNTKAKRTSRRSSSPSSSYSSSRERENESSSPCPSSPNSDVYPALSPLSPSSSESGSTSPVHSLSPTADSTSATDTLVPVSLGDLLLSMETKQKRLARKAELARMSRKRKATRMGDLEAEVDRLQKEIATLKKQKQARVNATYLGADDSNHMNAHENVHSKMNVEDDSDVKLVYNALEEIITAYHSPLVKQENLDVDSDVDEEDENSSSHSRQLHRAVEAFVAAHTHSMNATEKHLTALASHTQPILPLQFLQWICSQNDKFYEAPNSLWRSLFVGELNTSDEQMRDLLALKTTVRKQSKLLYDIEKAYKKLSTAMKKQLSQRVENLEKVRSILTTQQLAKYMEWTNKYGQVCLKINTNSQE